MQYFFNPFCLVIICFCMVFVNSKNHEDCDCEQLRIEIESLQANVKSMPILKPINLTETANLESGVGKTSLTLIIGRIRTKSRMNPSLGSASGHNGFKKSNGFKTLSFNGRKSNGFEKFNSFRQRREADDPTADCDCEKVRTEKQFLKGSQIKATKAAIPSSPTTSEPSLLTQNQTKSLQVSATATATFESGVGKTKLFLLIGKVRAKSRMMPSSGSVGGRNSFKKPSFGFNGRITNSFKKINSF